MNNDREMLELAALAAGYELHRGLLPAGTHRSGGLCIQAAGSRRPKHWNSLTDDGDALRLAVKLGLVLNLSPRQDGRGQTVVTYHGVCKIEEPCYDGEEAAARRAITRAAAELGRQLSAHKGGA